MAFESFMAWLHYANTFGYIMQTVLVFCNTRSITAVRKCRVKKNKSYHPDDILIRPDDILIRPGYMLLRSDDIIICPDDIWIRMISYSFCMSIYSYGKSSGLWRRPGFPVIVRTKVIFLEKTYVRKKKTKWIGLWKKAISELSWKHLPDNWRVNGTKLWGRHGYVFSIHGYFSRLMSQYRLGVLIAEIVIFQKIFNWVSKGFSYNCDFYSGSLRRSTQTLSHRATDEHFGMWDKYLM